MFNLSLYIYYKLKDSSLIEVLMEAFVPERVSCIWNKLEDSAKIQLPDNCYSLLLTDCKETLSKIEKKPPYSTLIYIGYLEDSCPYLELVDQIWNGLGNASVSRLFTKYLDVLRTMNDAAMGRSAMETIMDTSPDMVWIKRVDGLHLNVNQKFADIVGRTKEDCFLKTHEYIWDITKEEVEEGVICIDSEAEVIKADHRMMFEETVQLKDKIKILNTYKSPIHDLFGNIIATCGIGKDVTDFNNMGLEMSIFIENTPLPVLVLDGSFNVLRMNTKFKDLTRLQPNELAAFNYKKWKEDYLLPVSEPISEFNSIEQEFSYKYADNKVRFILIEHEIRDYFGVLSGFYCVFLDVTLRRKYEQMLYKAATVDNLTGLYNRRFFYEYISERKNQPMTILYIDLDHFKEVNDTFGHARGDEVLRNTAGFLVDIFEGDTVARLGGDEFAVLHIGDRNTEKLKEKGDLLNKKIRALFRKDGIFVSASIGIAESDGVDLNVDAFIQEGDRKMYEIKKKHHAEGSGKDF